MRNLTIKNIEFISVDEIYRIASEETDKGDSSYEAAVKAIAEAHGDKEIVKSLFIKFQYEELFKQEAYKQELADKQRQRQMEIECKEIELAERRRDLKLQRRLEFERSKRKLENFKRWGFGIATIAGIVLLAGYFGYKDRPAANLISGQNKLCVATPENTRAATTVAEYHKAAEQGDIKAQLKLAVAYKNGKGIAKDEVQAALWFRKAAEKGNVLAQDMLGYLYANGKGVAKDKAQAAFWYRKAAEQGSISSQFNLAIAYKEGLGLTKDAVQAVKWFEKAANQGDAEAQAILGKIYEYGMFEVKKNDLQAKAWYQKAARQGNRDALDALLHLKTCLKN